jgi:hypothetical protein
LRHQTENGCDGSGGEHDAQGPSKTVEDESCSGLPVCRWKLEFGRKVLKHVVPGVPGGTREQPTNLRGVESAFLALFSWVVDADASNKDIMDDGEDAFTADPEATTRSKTNIVKHGGLVKEDTTRVDRTCKRDLVRMEEVK